MRAWAVHCVKCVIKASLNMQDWQRMERGVSTPCTEYQLIGSTCGSHVPENADDVLCAGAADPFLNDQNYVLCVLSLEELGATGNKVSPTFGVTEAGGYLHRFCVLWVCLHKHFGYTGPGACLFHPNTR